MIEHLGQALNRYSTFIEEMFHWDSSGELYVM
jgi:hypothetical protein